MNKEDFFYWIKEYLSDAKDGLTPKQVEYILDHIKDVENPLDNQGGYYWTSNSTFID